MQGLITRIISNQYQVTADDKSYLCLARGKVRLQMRPLVGDRVIFEDFEGIYGIEKVLPRHNELQRPAIANVDQVIIVMSAIRPDFSTATIDRLSFLINYENLPVHLLVTKLDLLEEKKEIADFMLHYRNCGFQVVDSSDVKSMLALFADKISVLAGQSGVGKSTSINRLNPDFNLVTQEVSKALKRGKHTTRYCCLYPVGQGWVGDTPGFSAIDYSRVEIEFFANCPQEWQEYLGHCKYRNCIHENEPGCKIKELAKNGVLWDSRYRHYLECLQLIRSSKNGGF